MNCKHATLDGTEVLVNFKTKGDRVVLLVQKMDEALEFIEVNGFEISDLCPSVAIVNGRSVLQMQEEDLAYAYARFHIARKHRDED